MMYHAYSSIEVEYHFVACTIAKLTWISSLLHELGVSLPQTTVIYYDNIKATFLYVNPIFHSLTKHIAIDFHFLLNLVQFGALHIFHVSIKDQLVDALIKSLSH